MRSIVRFFSFRVWIFLPTILISGISWAADTLEVYTVVPEPGARSIYEFRFVLAEDLPAFAEFEIVFPNGFDLSEVLVVGSDAIDGGLSFTRSGQTLRIARSGLGRSVAAGTWVDLKIANVRNPRRLGAAGSVRMGMRTPGLQTKELTAPVTWRKPPERVER